VAKTFSQYSIASFCTLAGAAINTLALALATLMAEYDFYKSLA